MQGGTSGIGVTAIQMAAATGNRVFATAGSDEKCAACVRLGAAEAFNYKTQDFEKEISRVTGGKGVNVILDMVGGDYVPRELKCLADDGRLVFIAYLRGPKTELNIDAVMRRRLTITGSTLRPRPVEFKGAIARSLREKIWPLIEAGQDQAGDLQDLSARAGGRGPPPDGKLAAHRQDRLLPFSGFGLQPFDERGHLRPCRWRFSRRSRNRRAPGRPGS